MPLQWLTSNPVWVDQRPLPKEKLEATRALVQEQFALGHLIASSSPWNSPVFVI